MSSDQALWILACSWAPQKVIFITLLSLVAQKIRTFSECTFTIEKKTVGNQRGLERSYKILLTNIKRSEQGMEWNGRKGYHGHASNPHKIHDRILSSYLINSKFSQSLI